MVLKPGAAAFGPLAVRIDGKRPSEIASLCGFTRALAEPGGKWPVVADLSWEQPPLLEEWTMDVRADPTKPDAYTFDLSGPRPAPTAAAGPTGGSSRRPAAS